MRKKEAIKIGVDLDGVIACHLWGGFWVKLRKFKEKILKKANFSSYYYPVTFLERWGWKLINWSRKPFVDQSGLFPLLAKGKGYRFYLITSRFKFLKELTEVGLKRYHFDGHFEQILINHQNLNPFVFKLQTIKQLKLDFFIDDDFELIEYLRLRTTTKFYWVSFDHQERVSPPQVTVCRDFTEALRKIFKLSQDSSERPDPS